MRLKHYEHGIDIQTLEDNRCTIAKCSFCKGDIKEGNDDFCGDDYYYDGGTWACENCKDKFLDMFKVKGD